MAKPQDKLKIAIEHLQRAVSIARLPPHETYAKNADGDVTAANPAFKIGAMTVNVMAALRELGVEVAS